MSTQIKTRRGTAAEHTTFTGAEGELTVNTTNDSVHVHDGSTAGGHELAKADGSNLAMESDLTFGDNDKAIFGAGSDLQIFHDGGNSVIKDGGLGDLYIQGEGLIRLTNNGATEHYAKFNQNGAVQLYYDNAQKFSTTSTGIDVTGTATMDGLTVDGSTPIISKSTQGGIGGTLQLRNTSNTSDTGNGARLEFVGGDNSNRNAYIETRSTGSYGRYPSTVFGSEGDGGGDVDHMKIGNNGDISFYEDTGTTAKFFWDASAESLTVPVLYLNDGLVTSGQAGSASVFNEDGTTADFRVESTGNTHMLFVDGGLNRVGIGTSSPTDLLNISGAYNQLGLDTGDQATYGTLDVGHFTNGAFIGTQAGSNAASNVLRLGTGGTERMRIDSSGNLLVGKPSANSNLEGCELRSGFAVFTSDANVAAIYNRKTSDGTIQDFQKDGATVGSIGTYGGDMAFITGSIGLRLYDAGGSIIPTNGSGISNNDAVDLGEPNIRFKDLYLSGSVNAGATSGSGKINAKADASGQAAKFDPNYLSSGDAALPTTVVINSQKATALELDRFYSWGTIVDFKQNAGSVGSISVTSSATSYNTSSDYRLKEDWKPVTNASNRVAQLKPVNFAWKVDGSRVDGFLAHELAEVIPEAVTGTKDSMRTEEYEVSPAVLDDEGNVVTEAVMGEREVPEYQGIDQSKLVPLLTAALQEALTEIDNLKQRVSALENN